MLNNKIVPNFFFYLNPDTWELVLAFNFFIGAPISEFYATIVLSFKVSRVDYKYIVCISYIIFILHETYLKKWKKREKKKETNFDLWINLT